MKLISILLVIIAGFMWAGCGLAAQDFFQKSSLDSMDLTVFRMFCASGIMLGVTIAKGKLASGWQVLKKKPMLWVSLSFYGVIGLMAMHYTYFASIAAGNAAAATVIQYTCPAMVILWMSISHRQWPKVGELIAVVLAILGVFLLVTGGDMNRISVPYDCVYFGVASAVFFAVCAVYPKHLMGELDNSFILSMGMFTGAIAAFLVDPLQDISGFLQSDVLFDVFWIVVCGTAVAFTCYNAGLKWLSESQASVTATIEPAVSVVASYFLFGTHFDTVQAVGIVLVLLAIVAPTFVKGK